MTGDRHPILLVEDNPDDEELALMSFEEAGIVNPIDVVRDGVEASEYLFQSERTEVNHNTLPVLILLDLQIPKVNGFQILEKVRATERTRLVPVVVMSSSDVAEDIVRAYQLGCNSYVCKPVEFRQYAETLERIGTYWLKLNEVRR